MRTFLLIRFYPEPASLKQILKVALNCSYKIGCMCELVG